MRASLSSLVLVAVCAAGGPLRAQEFPAPVARAVAATGTFGGSVRGQHTDTLYNGDIVTERIDCSIRMRFDPDGTVGYDAGTYFFERYYYKKTTTGGYLVGHTRMTAEGASAKRNARLRIWITPDAEVQNAVWTPRVDQPSDVLKESWLTDGRGRTWGHSVPLNTHPLVYCEPKVLWRGKNKQGAGLPINSSYDGPDVFQPWAKVHAEWNFTVLR